MNDTEFIRSLKETAAWWDANKDRVPKDNLAKRLELQQIMIENLFNLFAYVAKDYRDRDVAQRLAKSGILTPH